MEPGRHREDFYRVLQVHPSAHPHVVRAAYRTLLKTLQKHPDVGGGEVEARRIIEAYATLSDPDRRREYDRWLRAHSAPSPAARAAAPDELMAWIGSVLPEYREASGVLFADRFDRVLQGPGPGGARVFLKTITLLTRARWSYALALRRAAQLARTGFRPADDVVLLLTPHADELDAFLATAVAREPLMTWHRCLLAVCTFPPPRIHSRRILFPPDAFRRLARARIEQRG
jgi:hypothetical protein